MNRFGRDSISADMLLLWVFETLACFTGLCVTLTKFDIGLDGFALFPAIRAGAINDAVIMSLLLGLLCFVLGLYRPALFGRTRSLLATACIAAIASVPVVWAASAAGVIDGWAILGSKRAWLAELMLVWIALLLSTRLLYAAALRSGILSRDVFATDSRFAAWPMARAIATNPRQMFGLTNESIALDGGSRDLMAASGIGGADACAHTREPAAFLSDAIGLRESPPGRVDLALLAHRPAEVASIRSRAAAAPVSCAIRRAFDLLAATALLILTLPVMVLTALAIMIDSPGPLIYRQERVGLGGKPFTILKLRSMRIDAERGGAMFAQPNDPRVTRVGRVIRLLRIDELPQLINVLHGEMSMVGPRPERPGFVRRYEETIPFYGLRALVKPGVTGWAQIKAPYTASDEETREKLSYDLYYLENRSLLMDLRIMMATIRVILFKIGAR